MKAQAPGKLILSGEHSVVYGAPAIATAVAQQATAFFVPNNSDCIEIVSAGLGMLSLPLVDIASGKLAADERFSDFSDGVLTIDQVLDHPLKLIAYCLAYAGFEQPGRVLIESAIPTGSGMGSSAAVIAAVLRMAGVKEPAEQFVQSIRYCERLQHGHGSVIDASAVALGGMIKVESGKADKLNLSLGEGWYVWNSGQPESSTGQTVAWVSDHHADSAIWKDFSAVTRELIDSIGNGDHLSIRNLVNENQRLLNNIGVVPEAVMDVTDKIYQMGGAAKICGAGALNGHAGGQVLAYLPGKGVDHLQDHLMISLAPLKQASIGASCVDD